MKLQPRFVCLVHKLHDILDPKVGGTKTQFGPVIIKFTFSNIFFATKFEFLFF